MVGAVCACPHTCRHARHLCTAHTHGTYVDTCAHTRHVDTNARIRENGAHRRAYTRVSAQSCPVKNLCVKVDPESSRTFWRRHSCGERRGAGGRRVGYSDGRGSTEGFQGREAALHVTPPADTGPTPSGCGLRTTRCTGVGSTLWQRCPCGSAGRGAGPHVGG